MSTKSKTRKSLVERKRREANRKRLLFGGMIIGGVLLLAVGGWTWWEGKQEAQAASEYNPEDIAYDQPLNAVHEMEAGGPPIPFLPRGESQPSIAINEKFFNFGSVGPSEVVTREFIIANIGEAPLTISRAYTTCGCTTADFTSSVIPPGKVSVMTLRFDAGFHDARGETVRRGVIIENNDRSNSNVEIWVQASVRTSQ